MRSCHDSGAPTLPILDDDDILKYVLCYVGDHHYPFVGGDNRSFQEAYIILISEQSHTSECSHHPFHSINSVGMTSKLPYGIIWRQGNIDVVKYLLGLVQSVKYKRPSVCHEIDFRALPESDRWVVDIGYIILPRKP